MIVVPSLAGEITVIPDAPCGIEIQARNGFLLVSRDQACAFAHVLISAASADPSAPPHVGLIPGGQPDRSGLAGRGFSYGPTEKPNGE